MATIVTDAWEIDIPADVLDLDAFRRWAHSDQFPEHGRPTARRLNTFRRSLEMHSDPQTLAGPQMP